MNKEIPTIIDALVPIDPTIKTDYSHTTVFGTIAREEISEEDFVVDDPLIIKNQYNTDFCTGFGTTEVSEDQEREELNPLYQFAKIKQITGDYQSWGANLRAGGMSLVNYGSLPERLSPYKTQDIVNYDRDFLANHENWPKELDTIAIRYKKGSMFAVDGPYDTFDNIRVALIKNQAKKQSILCGTLWHPEWTISTTGIISKDSERGISGHCFKLFGQKKINGLMHLVAQLSNGEAMGDKGIYYFPREIINREFPQFGLYIFNDMPKDEAKHYHENNISVHDSWIVYFIKMLRNLLLRR